MKRLMIALAVVLVPAPASLWAQGVPKAEFFGGFGVAHVIEGGASQTPIGFQANVAFDFSSRFGIVGDVMRANNSDCYCKFGSFTGGFRFNHRMEKATVFVQSLWGGLNYRGIGEDDIHFTMQYGVGVDVRTTNRVSIRVIEFNWRPVHATGGVGWETGITSYGFGIVFKTSSR
jgi:hypothetical protein